MLNFSLLTSLAWLNLPTLPDGAGPRQVPAARLPLLSSFVRLVNTFVSFLAFRARGARLGIVSHYKDEFQWRGGFPAGAGIGSLVSGL